MFANLLCVVGGALLLASACLAAPGGSSSRVVGGDYAAINQFPHQISLRNRGAHSCGGSILSKNWVLTAAHCVTVSGPGNTWEAYPASQLSIRAGSNDRFSGGVLVNVIKVIVHEGYGNFLNDLAVLCVEKPFIFSDSIQPISLPSENTPADAPIIISGWGRLWHGGDLPRYLQWNTLTSISFDECQKRIKYGYPSMLCLLHPADNGACNGDSGGPAHYNNEIVGIAGFVYNGCGSANPDGYARVYHFNDWIRANTDL